MTDKLDIRNEMKQFDRKNRDFYDQLTDDEKKKFSTYLMIRWGSTVEFDRRLTAEENYFLQSYYLQSTNERVNKNFFDVSNSKHAKLQWLSCTTVSPGMGDFYHPWIGLKRKTSDNKSAKFLRKIYPTLKEDEIRVLCSVNSKQELKALAHSMGWTDEDIKKEL